MGNFYTNITLRGADPAEVADVLRHAGRSAYVAPRHPGGTTVYDERCESQDPRLLGDLAASLSARWACPALAVLNHDDDILALALYQAGELVGDYETGHADGLRSARLCRTWGRRAATPLVWLLLHGPRPVFEVTRHGWLARLLGLPPWSVATGFRYIEQGELPSGLAMDQLVDTRRPKEA